MKLEQELRLKKSFQSLSHEAILSLYYTAALIKKGADEFFRDFGTTDVQFNVMMLLSYQGEDKGGLTQVELSRMMLVNRANITSLIDRMEKAKLVTRAPVPGDRRYHVVRLTQHGKHLLQEVEAAYIRLVEDITGALTKDEEKHLVSMLDRVRDRLRKEEE